MRIHDGFKPSRSHTCSECDMSFIRKSYLNSHMVTHTGIKPLICKECGLAFSQSSNLHTHTKMHTEGKPTCVECNKSFSSKQYLEVHMMKTHSGIKPHSSSECGKSFVCKSHLNSHMVTHSGI